MQQGRVIGVFDFEPIVTTVEAEPESAPATQEPSAPEVAPETAPEAAPDAAPAPELEPVAA